MIGLLESKAGGGDRFLGELFLIRWNELEYRWAYREEREYAEFVDMGGEG